MSSEYFSVETESLTNQREKNAHKLYMDSFYDGLPSVLTSRRTSKSVHIEIISSDEIWIEDQD